MKTIPATILVVDDEPKAQVLLRNLLEVEGYRVLLAGDGPAALAAAREKPDAVLLDLMMPGMDGYEVCTKLRAEPELAAVPIIMLTALDDRASRLRGLQAGADDFLGKPFDSAELRARLRTITRLNRYRRLSEERARFEAAIQHAPEGIVLAEADGRIIHTNAAFAALLEPGAVLDNWFDCLAEEVEVALRAAIAPGPAAGVSVREAQLRPPGRAGTCVEITTAPVPWEGRTIVQYHLRDLTEKKSLEAQLLRAQRIELLGQLAGSVVHDMNNVLTAIGGIASLMEMTGKLEPIHLQHIQKSVQRGGGMMRQLLMFARGSDGDLHHAALTGVVAEVAELVRGTFGRQYETTYACAAELPEVAADATQVHQVIMNLCVNGRDAMPEGGTLQIGVGRRELDAAAAKVIGADARAGDFVTVSVRDNGSGIPPEILPRLFDPFFTTKPRGKGTGLGLATVLRVMRRHQGFVSVETAPGQGTCFTCFFPVAPAPTAARAVA